MTVARRSGVSIINDVFQEQNIVSDASDFPSPVAGERQLEDNKNYVIDGVISIADTIVPGVNTSITSLSNANNELNYTGTGSMFKGTNKSFVVGTVKIRCASGTLNDWTDTSPLKDSVIEYDRVIFPEIDKIGLCTDVKQIRYFACVFQDIKTTGATYAGDIGQIFSVDTDYVINGASPVHDLGTVTSDLVWHVDYQVNLVNAGSSWISGLADSANINTGGLGQSLVGLHIGAGTDLINVTPDDTLWNFQDINRVADSRPDALTSFSGNAAETAIADIGAAVKVNATWVASRESRFTADSTGKATYTGEKDAVIPVTVSVSSQMASAGSKDIAFTVALNGTPIANSLVPTEVSGTKPSNISLIWQLSMETGDFLEVFAQNDVDTVNIIVTSAVFRMN